MSLGLSADQLNLANTTDVAIIWDVETYDTDAYHDGVNPTRMTAPSDGYYLITGNVGFYNLGGATALLFGYSISAGGKVRLARRDDGGFNTNQVIAFTRVLALTSGQYIELWAQIIGVATGDLRAVYTTAQLTKVG